MSASPWDQAGSVAGALCVALIITTLGCATGTCPAGTQKQGELCIASDGGVRSCGDGGSAPCSLDILLLVGGADQLAFEPGTTSYETSVGFLATSATLQVSPANQVARVSWQDQDLSLDSNGAVNVPLTTGAAGTLIVEQEGGPIYTIDLTRRRANELSANGSVKAALVETRAHFGSAVALDNDTLVVGAPDMDDGGRVFVYVQSSGVWEPQATFSGRQTEPNDKFGADVSMSGDTVVVGAPGEDSDGTGVDSDRAGNNGSPSSGAVYVFVRSGPVWTQQAYLKASNAHGGDNFGTSVAIDGATVVVGAQFESSSVTGAHADTRLDNEDALASGAAYVFVRDEATWTQQAYLKSSNTGEADFFGSSVAISNDTIVVGAPEEDSNLVGVFGGIHPHNDNRNTSGAVYVFGRNNQTWAQQAYLKTSNSDEGDRFGTSVAIYSDTVVAGAPDEDSNTSVINGTGTDPSLTFDGGAAYVFERDASGWSERAILKASNPGERDYFGASVAIHDGAIAVGAPWEDNGTAGLATGSHPDNDAASDSGAVYVFTRSEASWIRDPYTKAGTVGTEDNFGWDVALCGDVLAAGAPNEDSQSAGQPDDDSVPDSGATYLFQ